MPYQDWFYHSVPGEVGERTWPPSPTGYPEHKEVYDDLITSFTDRFVHGPLPPMGSKEEEFMAEFWTYYGKKLMA